MPMPYGISALVLVLCLGSGCGDSGGGATDASGDFTVVQPTGAQDASSTADVTPTPVVDAGAQIDSSSPSDTAASGDVGVGDTAPQPADISVSPEDAETSSEASPFVGRWALRYWVNSQTEVPVLGGIMSTVILSLQIVDIIETDSGLSFSIETCSVEMIAEEGAMNETVLPDAFVDSIPVSERTAVITDDGQGFYAEPFYEVRGAQLDDLIEDALPTDPADPKVIDQDQDGHPGMTISVTGFVDGDIYLVQRGWNALQTTSFDGARAFGTTEWGDEQAYLGASSFILEQITPSSWPDPETSKHGFELVYAPQITCIQLMATAATIFESH
jgi:hypothetical protein